MKLIKFKKHVKRQPYESNILISFGRCYKTEINFIEDSIPPKQKLCEELRPCGWYLRIEIPFISDRHYTDSCGFYVTKGPCRKVYMIQKIKGIKKFIKHQAWLPV